MPEIVLLAGTETVPFADVPQLFAKAIYPEVPEDASYTVTGLRKFPLSAGKTLKWCGEGRTPRSVTCTDKDMVQLLKKFWSHLPKLELPIDGDKWKPYWDAYEENPPHDWQLKMDMNNPRNDWFAKFCITVAEYETQLKKAFSDGSLTVHSALTRLPLLQSASDSLLLAGFITVNALREFAAKSQIDIRVACNEGAVAQATAPAESKPLSETGDKCNDSKPVSVESKPQNNSLAGPVPANLNGEPPLQPGRNKRANVGAWVKWQAKQLKKDDDNGDTLATRIKSLADEYGRGYESERGALTVPTIIKMLPSGITGGRGKNRSAGKK